MTARADDVPPPPRAPTAWNWTGFYAGGHVGAFTGTTIFNDPNGVGLFGGSVVSRGFLAGLQAGYNWQAAPQLVLGVEADASLLTGNGANTCQQSSPSLIGSNCKVMPREIATLTGRVGFVTEPHGRTLIYGKAGAAWMRADVSLNPNHNTDIGDTNSYFPNYFDDTPEEFQPTGGSVSAWGATVGAGVERAIGSAWSLKLEYNYLRFNGMSATKPGAVEVTPTGNVTNMPFNGTSSFSQDFHIARLGLNYHFGGGARQSRDDAPAASDVAAAPWIPGWEFEGGVRYWYSSASYQNSNGAPNVVLSRLSYNNMAGHSGEVFARADTPIDIFVKGLFGVGAIKQGQMYDEDWGIGGRSAAPMAYTATQSNLWGSFNYATIDLGYNLMRGPDHKVGLFVGYNLYQTTANAMGCVQIVQPSLGGCAPSYPLNSGLVSQFDTWGSIRLGVSAEARIWERLKLGADFAYLPYVAYSGVDAHWARLPAVFFPFNGTGNGVQAEVIATYDLTNSFSVGVGGRYWAMWTNLGSQSDMPSNSIYATTSRYGVFLQASYKFQPAR